MMAAAEDIPTLPEGVKVGARVAELSFGHSYETVTVSTVERITKRDVVLANGNRYNTSDLNKRGEGTYARTALYPADNPRVLEAIRCQRIRNAVHAAEEALRKWRRSYDPKDGQAAVDIISKALHGRTVSA
jgi:hypothetical protein